MNRGRKRVNPIRGDSSLTQDRRRLRYRRIAAGLTVRDAARITGVHWTTISKLETGERCANPRTLATLATAYGCEIADIMQPEPKGAAA